MKQLNHFNVSIIKSIIRLVGYGLLLSNTFIADYFNNIRIIRCFRGVSGGK